jgi:SAM-dependent methyltransferase
MDGRSEHWNGVYQRRAANEVSWFQSEASTSLKLVEACACSRSAAIVDVGAGASTLVDGLLAAGYGDVTLLDIAESALAVTRARLVGAPVHYEVADVTGWKPPRTFDVWHDRAVFHFLTNPTDRAAYREALARALTPKGHVILGTFALDGPERCSGLPVQRYSARTLAEEFAGLLKPAESTSEVHVTPSGSTQAFVFARFTRV